MPTTRPFQPRLPVDLLQVGDSFFVPVVTPTSLISQIKHLAEDAGIVVRIQVGIDIATGMYGIRCTRVPTDSAGLELPRV